MMSSVQLGGHLRVTWRVPLPAVVPAAWAALPGLRSRGSATRATQPGRCYRNGAARATQPLWRSVYFGRLN